MIFSYIHSSEF